MSIAKRALRWALCLALAIGLLPAMGLAALAAPTEYTVTVSASPAEGGTVELKGSPNANGKFYYNNQVHAYAKSADGWHFVKWTENGSVATVDGVALEGSAWSDFTYNVKEDRHFVAVFASDSCELTLSADPAAGGTVETENNTPSGTFNYNSVQNIHAKAEAGYKFVGWYENGAPATCLVNSAYTDKNAQVHLLKDTNLVAKFEEDGTALKTIASVNLTGFTAPSGGNKAGDAKPAVIAESGKGYEVRSTYWCDASGVSISDSTIFVSGEKYYAQFVLQAQDGYEFDGTVNATVNGSAAYDADAVYEGGAYGRLDVIAEFTASGSFTGKYKVTASAFPAEGGTVSGAGEYDPGTMVHMNAYANTGYHFVKWQENGVQVSTNASYTIVSLEEDRNLVAVFEADAPVEPITYAVTVSNGTGGGNYAEGAAVAITANAPEAGKQFKEWTGTDGLTFTSGSKTSATATFTMPANDVTVTATYEDAPASTYTVTWKSQDGSSTLETDNGVASGSKPSYDDAEPAKAADAQYTYAFAGWATSTNAEAGKAVSELDAVSGDVTYYAAFSKTLNTYAVAVSADNDAYGTVSGGSTYDYGTDATVSAIANDGYHFVKWTENGTEVSADSSYTFTVISGRNLVAVFKADEPAAEITGIAVTPASAEVEKGESQQFAAEVSGTGDYNKSVQWSITGGTDSSIDANGKLTVGVNETATTLTVIAKAAGDVSKTASATVTVKTPVVPPANTTGVTVNKVWAGDLPEGASHPDSVTVYLMANGTKVQGSEIVLSDGNQWTCTWDNLAVNDQSGAAITYGVDEVAVDGYDKSIASNATVTNGFTITNTYIPEEEPETVDVYGTKTWVGDEEADRPESIIVNLLANGEVVGEAEVTARTQWTFSFTGLPKYDESGAEIVYAVEEEAVEGYTATYEGFDITNTYRADEGGDDPSQPDQPAGPEGDEPKKPEPNDGESDKEGVLAQTGDDAPFAGMLATFVAAGIAVLALRRRIA